MTESRMFEEKLGLDCEEATYNAGQYDTTCGSLDINRHASTEVETALSQIHIPKGVMLLSELFAVTNQSSRSMRPYSL